MKKYLLYAGAVLLGVTTLKAQVSEGGIPVSFKKSWNSFQVNHQVVSLQAPDTEQLSIEDQQEDLKSKPYRVGVIIPVNLNPENSGTWYELEDGSQVWRLSITAENAKALGLYFSKDIQLPTGAELFVYNKNKKQILGAYTSNTPTFRAMEMVQGDLLTIEYFAPKGTYLRPEIAIGEVAYFYRGVQDHVGVYSDNNFSLKAASCQVDVACTPERNGWEDQINSVVHYSFNQGGSVFVCSGAVVNNTAMDFKPYILSAWHCGEPSVGTNISAWVWYWNYQKTVCQPSGNGFDPSKGSQTMSGGQVRASSANGTLNNPPGDNEVAGSDFYLAELNSTIPHSYGAYFAGWDRRDVAATSGVGIHHPAGSAKKISTYSTTLLSSTYNGGATDAHWRVRWAATTNGHGVTEGGSSGSPIFNQNGRIVGQLSGGLSTCASTSSPDLYGKLYSDWDRNGTSNQARLKPWLDPGNTGATSMEGAYANAGTNLKKYSEELITVYPNPTGGKLYVELPGGNLQDVIVSLFDMSGKQLFSDIISGTELYELNLTDVSTGVYHLTIQSGEEIFRVKVSRQ